MIIKQSIILLMIKGLNFFLTHLIVKKMVFVWYYYIQQLYNLQNKYLGVINVQKIFFL